MAHYIKHHPFIVSVLTISFIVPLLSLISEDLIILLMFMNPIVFIFVWGPLHLWPVVAAIVSAVLNYLFYLFVITVFTKIINLFEPKSKESVSNPSGDNASDVLSISKPKAPLVNWGGVAIVIIGIMLLIFLSLKFLVGWGSSTL